MSSPLEINGSTADGYCTTTSGPYTTQTTMLVGAPSSDSADSDTAEWHSFLFFDTSSLPNDATITEVQLDFRVTAVQGDPSGLKLNVYIGADIIGSTLDKTDYNDVVNGGTIFGQFSTTTGSKSNSVDDEQDVFDAVSLTGYTNFEFDGYFIGSPTSSGLIATIATQENATAAYRPKLTVYYTAPDAPFTPKVMIF